MSSVMWNERTIAHLLRRVGFGATPEEIKFYLNMGMAATIDYLLNYEEIDDSEVEQRIAQANFDLTQLKDLIAWWLLRMIYTKRPLQEKMVLFWHGHFATSLMKVGISQLMLKQNFLFRQMALGNFEEFLLAVSQDPAMIIWLDNFTNIKGQPNENYARELMELFSMGVNTYTQKDVQESARAFTGWTVNINTGEFFFDASKHDFGTKTFLGQTGPFNGNDIVSTIAGQPATSRFITKKLFEFFVYKSPSDRTIDKLAQVYLNSNYSIKSVMRAILTSEEFYSEQAFNSLVKSPTELIVHTARLLKLELNSSARDLAEWMPIQGQILFVPPSVKGWDGGLAWINTSTLLSRYLIADLIAVNRDPKQSILTKNLITDAHVKKPKEIINFLLTLLGLYDLSADKKKLLLQYLLEDDNGQRTKFHLDDATIDKKVRGLIHLMLCLSDYQTN